MKIRILLLVLMTFFLASFMYSGCGGEEVSETIPQVGGEPPAESPGEGGTETAPQTGDETPAGPSGGGNTQPITAIISPLDGSTNVSPNQTVIVTFSSEITEPSDWATSFTLAQVGSGVSLCSSVSYNPVLLTATCNHEALTTGASYVVNVGGISDVTDASSSFGVSSKNFSFLPNDGAISVAPNSTISITFEGPIIQPSDWLSSFVLQLAGTGPNLCTNVIYDSATFTLVCEHDPLLAGTTYSITLSGIEGIQDIHNTFMVANAQAQIQPASGSTNVAPSAIISVTFSAPIAEPADWMTAFTLLRDGVGSTLCSSVAYDAPSLTATCIHNALISGGSYSAIISGIDGVSDGQASFTVKNADVTFIPADGATNICVYADVKVVFSGPIDEPVSWSDAFALHKNNTGTTRCTSVSYSAETLTATCVHKKLSDHHTNYTASVNGIAGVPNSSATFTTKH